MPLTPDSSDLCLGGILDSGQQRLGVCADDLGRLLAVLEDEEGGHGADAELLGHVGDLVDVNLDEVCAGEFFGEPVRGVLVYVCAGGFGE